MLIYIIIYIFVVFICIKNSNKIVKIDKAFFFLLAISSGFRYGVGTDYFSYVKYFDKSIAGQKVAEPGFTLLSILLDKLHLNSQSIFLVFAIFTMIFFYKGINFYTKSEFTYKPVLYLIFLIFTFFPSLNGMRQALAAAIIFYASKYLVEKKHIRFSLWVIVAMLFHFSSVIFLLLSFIVKKNYNRFTLLSILLACFVFSNLGLINRILEFIIENFRILDVGGYISKYLYSSYNMRHINFGIVFYVNIFIMLLFIFIKDKIISSSKDVISFNMFYLYILSGILSMGAPMMSRLTYFFSIYMALFVPKIIKLFDHNSKKVIRIILFLLYSILFFYLIINGYINGQVDYIPYNYNLHIFQ